MSDAKEPSHNWGVDEDTVEKEPLREDLGSRVRSTTSTSEGLQTWLSKIQSVPATAPPAAPPVEVPPATEEPPAQQELVSLPPPPEEVYSEADFEKDDEPFDRDDAQKIGIIGGKGVGKSYLFQAMVYRTYSGQQSGALTYFLEKDGMRLFTADANPSRITKTGIARTLNRVTFIERYQRWQRLDQTKGTTQQWYRLRLSMRTGWLGERRSAMDVEFFDGSGEFFFERQSTTAEDKRLWAKAYRNARVMVFCLPIWAAFPSTDLTEDDWEFRERLLLGFDQVVQNYVDMRSRHKETEPVSSILALTMADDDRSALRTLRDRWITPYLQSPHTYLKQLKKGSGVARYLANARKVSDALQDEFASSRDPRVASIPQDLNFGRGRPWIIPLSAIDGARLDQLEDMYRNKPDDTSRRREVRSIAPTPVHVELPLLVALCEHDNALM